MAAVEAAASVESAIASVPADDLDATSRDRWNKGVRAMREAAASLRKAADLEAARRPFVLMSDTLANRKLAFALPIPVILGLEESIDGTLLEHSMIIYGAGMSDSNTHGSYDLPILLAGGGAGRIKGGRHVKYPEQTQRLTNLQLTLLNKLGIPTEAFGDSTGEHLKELADI